MCTSGRGVCLCRSRWRVNALNYIWHRLLLISLESPPPYCSTLLFCFYLYLWLCIRNAIQRGPCDIMISRTRWANTPATQSFDTLVVIVVHRAARWGRHLRTPSSSSSSTTWWTPWTSGAAFGLWWSVGKKQQQWGTFAEEAIDEIQLHLLELVVVGAGLERLVYSMVGWWPSG